MPCLHVMPLSNCGRCTMGAVRAIHSLRVQMGCCIYFVIFSAELSRIATVDIHRPLLNDCEFFLSHRSGSRTLLLDINEFLDVISTLIVCFG